MITAFVLPAIAAVVLYQLIKHRKNYLFMIAIPVLFILKGAFELPDDIDTLVSNDGAPSSLLYYMSQIGTALDFMSHWIFSCQYLKTSLIFPRVFAQADLELLTS